MLKVRASELFALDLETLAQEAQRITRQQFGRTIALYAPLYLANYCENQCLYCGFSANLRIQREKLGPEQIDSECAALAATGIQNVLLLTGESHRHTPLSYLLSAVETVKKYFPSISIEVQPMDTQDYRALVEAGVDGLAVYQETYDKELYARLHPAGRKRNFQYRLETPARAAEAGIRQISIGALLGLGDWRPDVEALFEHLQSLEKEYPGVDFSLSFPRMLQVEGAMAPCIVSDADLVRIICVARILFPRVGINLSTREPAYFRDHVFSLGVTKMSAGSTTTVGGYAESMEGHDAQFSISDERSLAEVKAMLSSKEYDPVFTDWRRM
ncbi:MAG: 2-iminoacetate synthase ThiH [Verrucomicrobia bacterium]|nr:2-iminoacetate synthase ThiH [Verrucomicrobiota bacterium]